MAKIKILEINKNIQTQAQSMLSGAQEKQQQISAQLKAAKQFESKYTEAARQRNAQRAELLELAEAEYGGAAEFAGRNTGMSERQVDSLNEKVTKVDIPQTNAQEKATEKAAEPQTPPVEPQEQEKIPAPKEQVKAEQPAAKAAEPANARPPAQEKKSESQTKPEKAQERPDEAPKAPAAEQPKEQPKAEQRPRAEQQERPAQRAQGDRRENDDRPSGQGRDRGDRQQGRGQGDRRPGRDRNDRRDRDDRPSAQGRDRADRPAAQGGRDERPYGQGRDRGDRPFGQSRDRDERRGDRPPRQGDGRGPQAAQGMGRGPRPGGRPTAPKVVMDIPEKKPSFDRKAQNQKRNDDQNRQQKKRSGAIKEKGASFEPEFVRGARRHKKEKPQVVMEPIKVEHIVITGDTISVKALAEKTGKPVAEIIKKLMLLGMMCTINSEIDFDTAALVASEFGIDAEQKAEQTAEMALIAEDRDDEESELVSRPPVITIMGHVDHGKTSLLDKIRTTKVTETEAGGITQHIGAYTIEIRGKSITFLDTPGHEAFTAMRARGAQVTDIAVLVVAADDGVMPQTVEAINHAKSAGVPIIVAINKIDKAGADINRIKQALTEYELLAEEWGGSVIMVPVSAKTGEGIDQLLEMILLEAEMAELKANPNRMAKGTIIEARLDKGRGPVATVLIQNGTLRVQDTIVAGTAYGRVRAMQGDRGQQLREAGPSTPVEVIGFSDVPSAGDILNAVEHDKLSKQVAEERRDKIKVEKQKSVMRVSLEDLFSQIAEGEIKDLNLIVKADVQGSVEAVRQSLEKLSNDEVRVRVIHGGVGAIKESDVLLASASNAIIIGFNVRPDAAVTAQAEREKVDIRLYRIIYNAIEDIEKAMKGMLAPEFREDVLGHCEIRQIFRMSTIGTIGGGYVKDGKMVRNAKIRLLRDGIIIHEGALSSLKRFKDDVKEVPQGYECGLTVDGYNDIKEGDVIEAYVMTEIER